MIAKITQAFNQMKTAEKILIASLDLFNSRGESNVSSVDISLELDISPGNLYYHFKGKEVIVSALFELYKDQMDKVLKSTIHKKINIEDFFYFLFLILEKGHLFQFLYHNHANLSENYPTVAKSFKKHLLLQEKCIEQLLEKFMQEGAINADPVQIKQMNEIIGLVFTQSANYYALKGQDINDDTHLYKGLACILFALLPYMKLPQRELHQLQEAIATHSLANKLAHE